MSEEQRAKSKEPPTDAELGDFFDGHEDDGSGYCRGCGDEWPCLSARVETYFARLHVENKDLVAAATAAERLCDDLIRDARIEPIFKVTAEQVKAAFAQAVAS